MKAFPVLEGKIAERGIKKNAIAKRLGISNGALTSRLNGTCDFKWNEVQTLQSVFFPDVTKDDLMRSPSDQTT